MCKKIKKLFGILICSGLTAVIIGGGVFFARSVTAESEKRIKAVETVPLASFSEIKDKSDIVLCAHRGLSAVMPENTLPAIECAGERGYKRVEFDIHQTADGKLVLMHDGRLDRTTDGSGRVSSYSEFELTRFRIDNGANIENFEEKIHIPTLKEALEICKKYSMTPVIEVKRLTSKGIAELKRQTDAFEAEVVIMSYNLEFLKEYKALDADAAIWYITEIDENAFEVADKTGFKLAFQTESADNTDEKIMAAVQSGYSPVAFVTDKKSDLIHLYKLGIRDFITNRILPTANTE